ncbi:hypothetical protein [Kerstersia similis]|uniref:hypothetical protein n=1 Tax=Kerstersia similis TaxID=206505 RepID=UPI0039EF6F2D
MEDYSYITLATLRSISYDCLGLLNNFSDEYIFRNIFEMDLSALLSLADAKRLYVQKLAIENKSECLVMSRALYRQSYMFDVDYPKFHFSDCCKYLRSDFVNFIIPVEVDQHPRRNEIIDYCNKPDVRATFDPEKPDVFWAKIEVKYKIFISPERIQYRNSGAFMDKSAVDDLKAGIIGSVNKSLEMLAEDVGSVLLARRYAPSRVKATRGIEDEKEKFRVGLFFDFKLKIIKDLALLYFHLNEGKARLPKELLLKIGLAPCKHCYA